MKIPFWSPAREFNKYKEETMKAIEDVLSSGNLVLGYSDEIEKYEKSFAELIGTKHAVMCGAGTQALYLAYRALGIGKGDEVITTSHTFIATIDQIVALGAKPILVDIGDDGLIDPEEIKKAITPNTKAIVPVHLEGKICDMDKIMDIADDLFFDDSDILVIEDGAQAIGAKGLGRGDAICFSNFPAKILGSVGNSGIIGTNNEDLANRLRMMRCNWNIGKNPDIENAEYGVNMEPDATQAAVLNLRLKYFPERLARRKEIAEKYDEAFKELPIVLPVKQEGRVYQDYVCRLEEPEKLRDFLREKGIGTLGVGLIPNHKYPKLKLDFNLPKTDRYLRTQIRLPISPDLTEEEVDYIIENVKKYFNK